MKSIPPVHAATEKEQITAISTIVLAFGADPMVRWTFSRSDQYLRVMPEMVRAFGGGAFAAGTADVVDGGRAAALWLPYGIEPDGERLIELARANTDASQLSDLMSVFDQMDAAHPREPHWYLPLIGVDPLLQSRGYGSALLAHGLARADRDRLPAYLESSNPRNISLYKRHGFEVVGTIQAGSSPEMFPMLRSPR